VGLRESKKKRTREEIARTAMRLFVKRGFEHVTVAEVALEAGVSEKTVFNYFPSKEDLFFDELPEREAALIETVRARKPGESIVAAMHRLQGAECTRLSSPAFAVFARIIEDSPALQAKEVEVMARFTGLLAEVIESELRTHPVEAKVAANMLVGVHWELFRRARAQALGGRTGPAAVRRLRADLDRAYRLLEHGLAALEPSAAANGA
jgi:AcrR family transcriptional regulator